MKLRLPLIILIFLIVVIAGIVIFPRISVLLVEQRGPVVEQRGPVSEDVLGRALQAERIKRERSMARYADEDSANQRRRFEDDAVSRRKAELEHEQKTWLPKSITPCGQAQTTARPTICVERLGSASRQLGAPVELKLTWRNLPQSAYIRLWVINGASAGYRWQYAGPSGAIIPDFKALNPSGTTVLRWDGKSTWCAPADAPMLCDNAEIGEYVVRAGILTGSDPFWPSWPDRKPEPVTWLALSETAPIAFTGNPRVFDNVLTTAWGPVNGPLRSLVPESYLIQSSDQLPTARLGDWHFSWMSRCRTIILGEPYSGTPELCFPSSRLDRYGLKLRPGDIYAQGNIGIARGVMPPGEARERAQLAAFHLVSDRARFITLSEAEKAAPELGHPNNPNNNDAANRAVTWSRQDQVYAYFHQERGSSYWIVTLNQSIGTLNYEEYLTPWESLMYRVDMNGGTCLLHRSSRLTDILQHECAKDKSLN